MIFEAVNLGLRFLLELAGLAAMAYWGWTEHDGVQGVVWAIGLPLFAAALWGTFRVPGDPGSAPVAVPGPVRLLLEMAFFGASAWLLSLTDRPALVLIFVGLVVFHHAASHERIGWLLSHR